MEKSFFERNIQLAKLMSESSNSNFFQGYIRGLRRAFHGATFGTADEHEKYMSILDDLDKTRQSLRAGYRAGFSGIDIFRIQTCMRCGWEFVPTRVKRDGTGKVIEILLPKTCPNPACNSPYWNRERTKGV